MITVLAPAEAVSQEGMRSTIELESHTRLGSQMQTPDKVVGPTEVRIFHFPCQTLLATRRFTSHVSLLVTISDYRGRFQLNS